MRRNNYIFLEEYSTNNENNKYDSLSSNYINTDVKDDFEELFEAIERDNEPLATQEFFYPIDKDYEYDEVLTEKENLRILIKHQIFKSKLNNEKFQPFKIRVNTHYGMNFTLGYLETSLEKESPTTLIVTRFYIYRIYRQQGYLKKCVKSVFKELFIRFYNVSKIKVVIFENDSVMKRLLLHHGFKLHESKSPNGLTNIKLTYVWTREEMRKTKNTEETVLSPERFKTNKGNEYKYYSSSHSKSSTTGSHYKDINATKVSSNLSFTSFLKSNATNTDMVSSGMASPSVASSFTYDQIDRNSKPNLSFLKVYSQLSAMKNYDLRLDHRKRNQAKKENFSDKGMFNNVSSILPSIGQTLTNSIKIDHGNKLRDYNYYEARERMNSFKQNRSLVHIKSKSYDQNSGNLNQNHMSEVSFKPPASSKLASLHNKWSQVHNDNNMTEQKIKIPKFTPDLSRKK